MTIRQFQFALPYVRLTHQTLDFLDRAWTGMPGFLHAGFMRHEAGKIRKKEPHFLLLDDLGVERDPCYLLQFTGWAAEHGLRYLGDSEFHTMLLENLPPESAKELAAMRLDRLQTEQMLDYISNRSFRCTLLVGAGAVVTEGLNAQSLRGFCFSPNLFPKGKFRSGDTEGRFVTEQGSKTKLRSEPLLGIFGSTPAQNEAPSCTPYSFPDVDRKFKQTGKNGEGRGEWRGGISPPRSPRTGRERLHSSGSYHPIALRHDFDLPVRKQTAALPGDFSQTVRGLSLTGSISLVFAPCPANQPSV